MQGMVLGTDLLMVYTVELVAQPLAWYGLCQLALSQAMSKPSSRPGTVLGLFPNAI